MKEGQGRGKVLAIERIRSTSSDPMKASIPPYTGYPVWFMDPSKVTKQQHVDTSTPEEIDPSEPQVPSDQIYPTRSTADPEATLRFAVDAARLCRDDKCTRVRLLDVRGISQVTDYIVIGSGTSERQMRSVLHHIEDLGKQSGYPAFRISADDRAVWLLADFVDVVVHLFEPDARQHYDLEMLWGDAPRVAWDNKPADSTEPNSDNSGLDGDEQAG